MTERYISAELQATPIKPLTPRQTEVLKLIAQGLTAREISKKLGVVPCTVDNFRGDPEVGIYRRLGTVDKIETVVKALHEGLLNPEEISGRFDFDKYSALTEREKIMLSEITKPENYFLGYKGIAYNLKLKMQTIRNASSMVYKKLGIKNRIDAILFEIFRPKEQF